MLNQNTVIVDTNVMVRFLIGDGGDLAKDAADFFRSVESGNVIAVLKDVVIAETVYVLEKVYSVPKAEISAVLAKMLMIKNIRMEDKETAVKALELYGFSNVDYADAYIVACGQVSGMKVKSYDKGVNRLLGN